MSNYSIKVNLTKLRKVKYFKQDDEQYVCIPVKANSIFNGEKGMYLELAAFQLKEQKFKDTHLLKLSVQKEIFDKLTKEQKDKLPIVGSLAPFENKPEISEIQNVEFSAAPKNFEIDEEDDLPF